MKYTVKMSCGHEQEVVLYGKYSERERKIEYFKDSGLCKECYKKQMEEEKKKEGLIFNVRVQPFVDKRDGSIMVYVWYSGDTKPHKDEIKEMGYYWEDKEGFFPFITESEKCWCKTIKQEDLNAEIEKAMAIGAVKVKWDKNSFFGFGYACALDQQNKWMEQREAIQNLPKPTIPDILAGHKWNQKIYGKDGNHSIYPDGEKVMITDEQADEIRKYLKEKEEYQTKIEEIKKSSQVYEL